MRIGFFGEIHLVIDIVKAEKKGIPIFPCDSSLVVARDDISTADESFTKFLTDKATIDGGVAIPFRRIKPTEVVVMKGEGVISVLKAIGLLS